MDDVAVAFKQAWAADYRMTGDKLYWPKGGWPYEGGGYWFDGLVRLGYALHDESLINQAKARIGAVIEQHERQGHPVPVVARPQRSGRREGGKGSTTGRHGRCGPTGFSAGAGGVLRRFEGPAGHRGPGNRPTAATRVGPHGWGMSNPWPAFEAYTWTGTRRSSRHSRSSTPGRAKTPSGPGTDTPDARREAGGRANDHGVHFLESTAPWALGYLWTGNRAIFDAAVAWHDSSSRDSMQPSA